MEQVSSFQYIGVMLASNGKGLDLQNKLENALNKELSNKN